MANEIKLVVDLTQFEQNIEHINQMATRASEIWFNVDSSITGLEDRLTRLVERKFEYILEKERDFKRNIGKLERRQKALNELIAEKEVQRNIIEAEIKVLKKNKKEAAAK